MQHIEDLSDLITLLSTSSTDPVQFELAPELNESLKGCLELGIKHLTCFDPMIMTPRQLSRLTDHSYMHVQRVWPKDFAKYLSANPSGRPGIVSVDRVLLAEGLSYLSDHSRSTRFSQVYDALYVLTHYAANIRVEVSRDHVEEVADWLDFIQSNRPNDIAEALRLDVKTHNELKLDPKI
jgi:hypothetical protein